MSYPLVFSPAELERLRRQHETWRVATEKVWQLASFGPAQTIVDLGCGPGFTTFDLARIVGERGHIVGVDAAEPATAVARDEAARRHVSNVRIVTANAADVDLSSERPDAVFARWLFCYLSNPAAVIQRVAEALRPGGTVAAIDYWHYRAIRTEPRSELFDRVFGAVYRSFADAGGSLDVAGDLAGHCAAAGLSVRHIDPICAVGRPGSPVWTWITDFQRLYVPTLVERGYLPRDVATAYFAWWDGWTASTTAFVFTPPMLAVVAVKE